MMFWRACQVYSPSEYIRHSYSVKPLMQRQTRGAGVSQGLFAKRGYNFGSPRTKKIQ